MTQFQSRFVLCVLLLIVGSQAASAELDPIRVQDPLSIMAEFSVAGPNGSAALNVSYDFSEWAGITAGAGFSLGSKAFLTSLMFDTRLVRGGDVGREYALVFSLGSSYRGPSTRVRKPWSLWGGQETIKETTASSTFYLNASIGYGYASRSGMRLRIYLGWEYPLHYSDHQTKSFEIDHKGNAVFERYSKPTTSPIGYPSIGLAFGSAF